MAEKYRVVVPNLVGFDEGDEVTAEEIEEAGGNADHLVKLGAVKASKKPTTKKEG